jgi:membrane fusion protein (multidrug efflux system)
MLAKARSDLNRYKPLAEINAVSMIDLDAAQANYDAALSSVEAAKSNLESAEIELGYTKVYSPTNGIIGKTQAKVGDFVGREPNPVILNTVSETGNVKVDFFLTESEYLEIFRQISKLRESRNMAAGERISTDDMGKLELLLADGTVYPLPGTIDFIDRGIDPSTGSMLVQGNFPNPDFILRPGLYGKVKVEMEVIKGAMMVPQRCVMELQGQYSVYVVDDTNMVESRQIAAGQRIDDYWLVTKGLNPGEKVVIDALQKVSSGMKISPSLIEFDSKTTQQ